MRVVNFQFLGCAAILAAAQPLNPYRVLSLSLLSSTFQLFDSISLQSVAKSPGVVIRDAIRVIRDCHMAIRGRP